MAKITDPRNLDRQLLHYGPYIYFYNAYCHGFNKSMVECVKKLSSEYPAIIVYELNWAKYSDYRPATSIEEIYKVYLVCDKKKEEWFMPDKTTMNEIFGKAIQLYNKNLEFRAKNVGSKGINIKLNEKYNSYDMALKRRLLQCESKRKAILRKKIISKPDLKALENNQILENNDVVNFGNTNITVENLDNDDSTVKPWFCNTNIIDLPCDILTNSPEKNLTIM